MFKDKDNGVPARLDSIEQKLDALLSRGSGSLDGETRQHIEDIRIIVWQLLMDANTQATTLEQIGVRMSELSDAVDALVARINEDVDHLLQLVADANARAEAAAANDAADAATIADLQAQNAAALADAQAAVDRIKSIDPVADFPPAPAPEEPPAG